MDFEIRKDRDKGPGRKGLHRERAAYFDLVKQGYSSMEACRIVGINRRTGKRWRNGRQPTGNTKGAPPVRPAGRPDVCSRYLGQQERLYIADRRREQAGIRTIARELGRSPSTISREIRRNGMPLRGDVRKWAYRPYSAQDRALARRPRPKPRKITTNLQLRQVTQAHLDRKLSPEQIAGQLRRDFPDQPEMHVVHETIYQALYIQGRGELRREIANTLRTGRVMRKPRRQARRRQPRYTHKMVMISERPAEVADRAIPGHWEGDLIIGKDGASAIGTLVERATRFVKLIHLPDGRSAELFRDALTGAVADLPAHLWRSLTWDQGTEMACHHAFTVATGIPVYFCDPASSWQRGSNENTNGLLRQYFPKGTDLSPHTPEHLDAVAAELNGRPRKTLGWDTPAERFAKLLAQAS
ncbi:IS30 family transposase [Saccharopolyspora sp. NPDC049426]|uniref:IS30 family transposase n=1 Tax=Saccharopolyspora sp. NPDC049426 TaxID=3155652 RepID=UPI00343EAE77